MSVIIESLLMDKLSAKILVDNTMQADGLQCEHGFSLWIEAGEKRILFDTGQGAALLHNVKQLGINLAQADAVVLSHGHYDHSGGLVYALDQAGNAPLYMHPAAMQQRFSIRNGKARQIGMAEEICDKITRRRDNVIWTTGPTEIFPGVHVTGTIPRRNDFEDTGGPFYLDAKGNTPDPIEDDQALWIDAEDGLTIILGCAHSGVVNTLEYIKELNNGRSIHTVIGGMHLGEASQNRIQRTLAVLRRMDISRIVPCHCSGQTAAAMLLRR